MVNSPLSRTGFAAVYHSHSTEELRVVGSQLFDTLSCLFHVGTRFPLAPVVSTTVSDVDGRCAIELIGTEPIPFRCSISGHSVPIAASGPEGGHLDCLILQKRIEPEKRRQARLRHVALG